MSTSNLKINHGPFAGQEFNEAESYLCVMDDGTTRHSIVLSIATQRFLERFPPQEGWAVEVHGEFLSLDMVPLREGTTHCPSVHFVATLFDPSGRKVGTASTVWTIAGPTEWERGETNARIRLYEAMGLQTRFGAVEGQAERSRGPASVTTLPRQVRPVTVTPVAEERKVAAEPAPADAAVEAGAVAPATPASGKASRAATSTEPAAAATAPVQDSGKAPAEPFALDAPQGESGDQAPPASLILQIQRTAALFGVKEVPELRTREAAMDYLKALTSGGK